MPKPKDQKPRKDRGPGAHSGRESQPQERVIRGTPGAREGYQTQSGTAHGEPIAGREAEPGDEQAAREAREAAESHEARRSRDSR
jgi:hypothetical protein